MIPLCDVIPTRTTPRATVAAVAALVVASLVTGLASPAAIPFLVHTTGLHLGTNALLLWLLGPALEDRLGTGRWLVLLAAGHAGSLAATAWMAPQSVEPVVGATGAVAALTGAYVTAFRNSQVLVLLPVPLRWDVIEVPAVFFAGAWLMAQLLVAPGNILDVNARSGAIFASLPASLAAGAALWPVLAKAERRHPAWWSLA